MSADIQSTVPVIPALVQVDNLSQLFFYATDGRALPRAFPAMVRDRRVWVKRAVAKSYQLVPALQKGLDAMQPAPVLRCTRIFNPRAALAHEIKQLKRFAISGVPVPDILGHGLDTLVLSDVGSCVWDILRADIRHSGLSVIAGTALADLHAKELFHGQPYPKNMAWDGSRIAFIDLEENVRRAMDRKSARLRDLWMMVHGHAPFRLAEPEIGYRIANAYLAQAGETGLSAIGDGIGRMKSLHARVLHGVTEVNPSAAYRRYRWTRQSIQRALRKF